MDGISSMLFHNCQSEKGNVNNDILATNHENCEMSTTATLKKISTVLFEENINENTNVSNAALQAVERSFYDILREKYSPSPCDSQQSSVPQMYPSITNQILNESIPILEFKRGMEEGMKFLPSIDNDKPTVDLQPNKIWFHSERKTDSDLVQTKIKDGQEEHINSTMLKGKRQVNSEFSLLVGRKCKIAMLHYKNRDEELYKVFLLHENHFAKEALRLRSIMENGTKLCTKRGIHGSFVDLRTLLIHCSEAIAINDLQNANLLIKRIKKHSFPYGDGMQRMAHIFVNGLEARLKGSTTSELYELLVPQGSIGEFLNCLHMYLVSCPSHMVSQYFINYTILNAIRKASKLHIVNLGTEFGFNWPSLIYELSTRIGGPPKLRITNIENPASSYLPAERIDVASQRLNFFSRSFGVPLEYRGLETKLDKICTHDLTIEKDEVVIIVNCYHSFEYLQEETDVMNNPKNRVLDIIRQIKPHVFIQSIINGSFNSSFFADRFKQVLLHTSAMFDLFDATMLHNNKQRWFLENIIWGRLAINLIACEGSKRCVGAETYKQWHTRNSRVGFDQLPLDHAIVKKIKDKVREVYHKSFFIDDDKDWLLLGWKGRVMSVISAWYPRQT